MITKKLTGHKQAQAYVEIHDNGIIHLVSYSTIVARIVPDTQTGFRWLNVFGLYSATTRTHLGYFMREYCGLTYQTAKRIYENNEWLCLDTGEVVENE